MNKELKDLLISLIEQERPEIIKEFCHPIWNQPFFYNIDKSKVITISYAPTDNGARVNYSDLYEKYKNDNNYLSSEDIFNILYTFKKEENWRRNYDKIFSAIGIKENEISHLDMSPFPYKKDEYRKLFQSNNIDNNYLKTLKVVNLLINQLKYIFIDGKDNYEIIDKYFLRDFDLIKESEIQVNKARKTKVYKYKHKFEDVVLIFVGTFLYGSSCPSSDCINQIVEFIKSR